MYPGMLRQIAVRTEPFAARLHLAVSPRVILQLGSGQELFIAKFHYTGPTGPDQTKSADFVGDPGLRPGSLEKVREGPRGSGRARVVEFTFTAHIANKRLDSNVDLFVIAYRVELEEAIVADRAGAAAISIMAAAMCCQSRIDQ